MALALQGDERKAVEAVRRFANLQRIESDEQVERCFKGLLNLRDSMLTWGDASGRQRRAVSSVEFYADVQGAVREWLAKAAGSRRGQDEVAAEVAEELSESVDAALTFKERRLAYSHDFKSVSACCAYGVALILDERRDLANRLKRCGWSKCGRFNLDLNPKGRPRRFCSPEHKRQADLETVSERVRKHRKGKP